MNQTDLQGETERALRAAQRADILGAVARGYCAPETCSKVIDATLVNAITTELLPLFNAGIAGAHAAAAKRLGLLADAQDARQTSQPNGETSDGYHTFNELYEHRHSLFSIICHTFDGWKSKLHSDGTMFDGWFIAGVQTPQGQATYHLPQAWWERFACKELSNAPEWDGHTPADVVTRLQALTLPAAIASAEARARLEEAEKWMDNAHHNRVVNLKGGIPLKCGCFQCSRINKLTLAAARTPDSTKEPE